MHLLSEEVGQLRGLLASLRHREARVEHQVEERERRELGRELPEVD